jgi:diketogulonate reductase-like aldo/keto reductase
VSNFNIELLESFKDTAVLLPHLIQNWAEPGNIDLPVRIFCKKNNILFQPYASLRNLKFLNINLYNNLINISNKKNFINKYSMQLITLNFFVQLGDVVIPRSKNIVHLIDNIKKVFEFKLNKEELKLLGYVEVDDNVNFSNNNGEL